MRRTKQKIKEDNKLPDTIEISWHYLDVLQQAKEIGVKCSKQRAKKILQVMKSKHDCNFGITWETINCYLEEKFK